MTGAALITVIRGLMEDSNLSSTVILAVWNLISKARSAEASARAIDWYYDITAIPVAQDEYGFALPDGTLYSAAPRASGHIHWIKDENGKALDEGRIQDPDFDWTRSGVPAHFVLKGNEVLFDRKLSAARTYTLAYYSVTNELADVDDEARIPDVYLPGLLFETVQILRLRVRQSGVEWAQLKDEFYALATTLSGRGVHARHLGIPLK
jgi:hypothetical protein